MVDGRGLDEGPAGSEQGLPVVLTQVMSYYGSNWVKTRQQQGDNTYFMVALEEAGVVGYNGVEGGGTSAHTNFEKVGWVAFEQASGNFGTRDFEAGLTMDGVTDRSHHIEFAKPFSPDDSPFFFFASMQSYLGTDSAELRLDGVVDMNGVSLHVEEDTCADTETSHAPEVVGYVGFASFMYGPVCCQPLLFFVLVSIVLLVFLLHLRQLFFYLKPRAAAGFRAIEYEHGL